LGLSLFLAGCSSAAPKEPINLAALLPLTGPDREQGRQAQQGVQLAAADINQDDKGILGRPLHVAIIDTRGDGQIARDQTGGVVLSLQRPVALIAGPDAAIAEQVVRAAHSYPTPVIVAGELADQPAGEGVLCLSVDPRKRGQFLARFAAQELKAKRAMVLAQKPSPNDKVQVKTTSGGAQIDVVAPENRNAVGLAVATGFLDEWPRSVPASAEEWRVADVGAEKDLPKRLAEAKAEVVLVCAPVADFLKVRAQCEAAKCTVPLLYGGEDRDARSFQGYAAGPDIYVATVFSADGLTDKGKAFAQKYQEQFHQPADLAAVQAYDAVRLIAEALQRNNSISSQDLRTELNRVDKFDSLLGPVAWKDRQVRRRVYLVRLHDQEMTVVKTFNAEE
jgi:branched-chain amino acid transport system substrate-binding protein